MCGKCTTQRIRLHLGYQFYVKYSTIMVSRSKQNCAHTHVEHNHIQTADIPRVGFVHI